MKKKKIIITIVALCLFIPIINNRMNNTYVQASPLDAPFELINGEGTVTYTDPEDGHASVILLASTVTALEYSTFNYTGYTNPSQELDLECYLNFTEMNTKSLAISFEDGSYIYLKFEPGVGGGQIYYRYPPSGTESSVYPGITLNTYQHLEVNITQTTVTEKSWAVYWNDVEIISRTYSSDVNVQNITTIVHGSNQWKIADLLIEGYDYEESNESDFEIDGYPIISIILCAALPFYLIGKRYKKKR